MLTDSQVTQLIAKCPACKIIIDGNELIGESVAIDQLFAYGYGTPLLLAKAQGAQSFAASGLLSIGRSMGATISEGDGLIGITNGVCAYVGRNSATIPVDLQKKAGLFMHEQTKILSDIAFEVGMS